MPAPTDPGTSVHRRIGVAPAEAMRSLERLLSCLQELFPVRFSPCERGQARGFDALLLLDGAPGRDPVGVTSLTTPPSPRGAGAAGGQAAGGQEVCFSDHQRVARPLRGRRLRERAVAQRRADEPASRDGVFAATARGEPVWWSREGTGGAHAHFSSFALEELGEGEALRGQLQVGRFMGLVPLLHWLRSLCGEDCWLQPPLRASFVFDDPNLQWPSYGFVSYTEMVEDARRHGYHVGLAMVPLDGAFAHPRAAALVRSNPAALSVLVHGNDHVSRELGRLAGAREAERVIGQALRRVGRFERRSGVRVRRVMAPPHGACSEAALRAMLSFGFEAACVSRPYPWRDEQPAPHPLAGWDAAELVAGGLPILPRYHLARPREELPLRALLGQPLILYGHHDDLAEGLEVLRQATADVNALGAVRWGALDTIARANFSRRRQGSAMEVQLHSRDVLVEVPEGVHELRVRTRGPVGAPAWAGVVCTETAGSGGAGAHALPEGGDGLRAASPHAPMAPVSGGWASEPFPVRECSRVRVSLRVQHPLDADAIGRVGPRPWPLARRALVQARDRARPLLAHFDVH